MFAISTISVDSLTPQVEFNFVIDLFGERSRKKEMKPSNSLHIFIWA